MGKPYLPLCFHISTLSIRIINIYQTLLGLEYYHFFLFKWFQYNINFRGIGYIVANCPCFKHVGGEFVLKKTDITSQAL